MGTCNRSIRMAPLRGAVTPGGSSGNEPIFCLPGAKGSHSLASGKQKLNAVGLTYHINGLGGSTCRRPATVLVGVKVQFH